MQDMNSIPVVGTFQDVADSANNNFLALKMAVDLLENSTFRSKGYFSSQAALESKYANPVVGDWAVVEATVSGSTTAYIYKCATTGTWTNTNIEWMGGDMEVIQEMIDETVGDIDSEPEPGSKNLAESGGIWNKFEELGIDVDATYYDYAVLANGKFGTSDTYKHAGIKVNVGERYIIKNTQDAGAASPYVRYAFATSNQISSGGNIPLVSGTEVYIIPVGSAVTITIPSGCTYLLINTGGTYPLYVRGYLNKDTAPTQDSKKTVESGSIWDDVQYSDKREFVMESLTGYYVNNNTGKIIRSSTLTLYFCKVKAGDVVRWNAVYTSGYMRAGFIEGSPVYNEPVSNATAYGYSDQTKSKTAPADGLFCVSFDTAGLTSLNVWLDNDKLGGKVYKNTQDIAALSVLAEEAIEKKVDAKYGANLFDRETAIEGKYINPYGNLGVNEDYLASDYISVLPETTYHLSGNNNVALGTNNAVFAFYNSSKTFISYEVGGTKTLTTPTNAAYMRISVKLSVSKVQVELGSERTTYQPYTPIGGYPIVLQEKQVEYENLSDDIRSRISNAPAPRFAGLRKNEAVVAGGYMSLPSVRILTDMSYTVKVIGSIGSQSVTFGVGLDSTLAGVYGSWWIVIDATNVTVKKYYNNESTDATYQHGLNLTSGMVFNIDTEQVNNTLSVKFTMQNNLGDRFVQTLNNWGWGVPFFVNGTAAELDVTMTFMPKKLTKKIWLFGDSYTSLEFSNRWPYYFANKGQINWLLDSRPGLGPKDAYYDLQHLLATGFIPSYIVWTLGMNGGNDTGSTGDWTIASIQKTYIDNVVALCEAYGITVVLATIPTVPTIQKTGLCNYVKSLGVRYIDFATAVGTDENGAWNEGLLDSDGVHPTAAGAKVLYSQVLIDFPELVMD